MSGCNVFNFTSGGVLVTATGAGNGWVINPSNFYQTVARTTAITFISIQGGSGHSIVSNNIGGTAPGAGGSNFATSTTFRGIDLTVGTSPATSVQGNAIKNIRSTFTAAFTASYGIFLQAGRANIGDVIGNTVGSSDPNQRIEINGDSYGIRITSTSSVNLSNNTVNNFGTRPAGAGGPPTGEFYWGLLVEGTGGTHTVVNNTVTNVSNASTPDSSFDTRTFGLSVIATGAQVIRGNAVSNIGSTVTAASTVRNNIVWGLLVSGNGAGTVVGRHRLQHPPPAPAPGPGSTSSVACSRGRRRRHLLQLS